MYWVSRIEATFSSLGKCMNYDLLTARVLIELFFRENCVRVNVHNVFVFITVCLRVFSELLHLKLLQCRYANEHIIPCMYPITVFSPLCM